MAYLQLSFFFTGCDKEEEDDDDCGCIKTRITTGWIGNGPNRFERVIDQVDVPCQPQKTQVTVQIENGNVPGIYEVTTCRIYR